MKKTVIAIALILSLGGCVNTSQELKPETTASVQPQQETGETEVPVKKIQVLQDSSKFDKMIKYEDCVTQVTGSGDDEVALLTSAEKDSGGEFMWDDSQDWALIVESEKGVYALYDDHIKGTPKLNVSEYYEEDGKITPVIRLSLSSSSGFEIREYRYEDNVFLEKTVYNTGAINDLSINKYY